VIVRSYEKSIYINEKSIYINEKATTIPESTTLHLVSEGASQNQLTNGKQLQVPSATQPVHIDLEETDRTYNNSRETPTQLDQSDQ